MRYRNYRDKNYIPSWLQDDPRYNKNLTSTTVETKVIIKESSNHEIETSSKEKEVSSDEAMHTLCSLFCGIGLIYLVNNKKVPVGSVLKLLGSMLNGEFK